MTRSESIKEITTALVQFHSKVGKVKKDANNPFFKSKYASLENILESVQPILVECNLNVMQFAGIDNELTTLLVHTSGEWFESITKIAPVKNDPQSVGSALTYARRYSVSSMQNINVGDDDDGAKASIPAKGEAKKADSTRDRLITALKTAQNPDRLIELKQYCKDDELLEIYAKREEEIYNA